MMLSGVAMSSLVHQSFGAPLYSCGNPSHQVGGIPPYTTEEEEQEEGGGEGEGEGEEEEKEEEGHLGVSSKDTSPSDSLSLVVCLIIHRA